MAASGFRGGLVGFGGQFPAHARNCLHLSSPWLKSTPKTSQTPQENIWKTEEEPVLSRERLAALMSLSPIPTNSLSVTPVLAAPRPVRHLMKDA